MRMMSNVRAISTFMLIILILCSVVFGAFISYLWVMSSYYNMPEDTVLLIVEDVVFPVLDANYFNVTIFNPSNSISDVNITAIRLSVEEKNEVCDVTTTDPSVQPIPFCLRRGLKQTFKCKRNWSGFAGETVRVEPIAANVSTKSYSCATPRVKLEFAPNFGVHQSIEYFDLAIANSEQSIINLTISEIMIFGFSINVTPSLPHPLSPNQMEIFRCDWNWENLRGQNVTITVKTSEGYESVYTTNELPGAVLYIDEIEFDYIDTTYFNLTVSSSEDSTATVMLNRVNLTLPDEITITLNTTPPLDIIPMPVPRRNESLTIRCIWDWNIHRNETIVVRVYTKQGFTVPSKTVRTPPSVVWNMTDVKFDLDYTEYFLVNVTNMPCSLQEINVTKILLDENVTSINPPFAVLINGTQVMFNCTFDWKDLRGEDVTLTVQTENGLNLSRIITIPSVGLKLLDEPAISELVVPYVNITISNSENSLQNVTITKIIFKTENGTYEIDYTLTSPKLSPDGYILIIGEKVTIVCPWNWALYLGFRLEVTVYTAEGIQVSETWYAPFPP